MGLKFAILNSFGKIPSESDLLKSCDRGLAINKAVSLRNFAGRSSGPVDLLVFNEFRIQSTSWLLVLICSRVGPSSLVMFGGSGLFFGISSERGLCSKVVNKDL